MLAVPAFPQSPVTIVSVGQGTGPGSGAGDAITSTQFGMTSWTSTVGFSDVTISAFLYTSPSVPSSVFRYLTTQEGPGASSASVVAQAVVPLPLGNSGSTPELQLFSGLTLPPGTYYLIAAGYELIGGTGWTIGDLPVPPLTAAGVAFNGSAFAEANVDLNYPPDSPFPVLSLNPPGVAFDVTGVPISSGTTTNSIIPQVVDGGSWQTTLAVTNTNTTAEQATLQFYQAIDAAGDTQPWTLPLVGAVSASNLQLAPGATVFLQTPGTASALTQGFGELIAGSGVLAYAIFTLHVPGRQNQDGTALAAAPASSFLVSFDNSPGFTTSIAIANASDAAETISANLLLASGETVSASLPSIPALGHAAFALTTQFPQSAGQQGTLELSSQLVDDSVAGHRAGAHVASLPTFSVIGLRFNPTGAFTSLPVYVVGAEPF
jgi:hypothetical protein